MKITSTIKSERREQGRHPLQEDEMSEHTESYVRLFTNIHRAEKRRTYPVLRDAEMLAEYESRQVKINAILAWNDLQSVPSYIEQQARAFAQEVQS